MSAVAPKTAAAHNQLGRDLLNQGKYAEGLAELNEALRLQPKSSRALNARGFAYLLMRNYALALADFDQAILLDPNYLNAYHNRSVARLAAGDAQGSAQDAAKERELTEKLIPKPGSATSPAKASGTPTGR